jgi:prepilin-type N-terminal cleavage/methylation domain-containing protein
MPGALMAKKVAKRWMQMLASCRTPDSAGFTLLEILMVLLLVGLVGGLVIPRVAVIYDNLMLRGEREGIVRQVESLSWRALSDGQVILLGNAAQNAGAGLNLPEGWKIVASPTVAYLANGFCTGGKFSLHYLDERTWHYRLNSPFCKPRLDNDAS